MKGYWIEFEDNTKGYCEGESAYDAVKIAEKITGKVAVVGPNKYDPDIKRLPYPAKPIIWQFDHPVNGKCPDFCYKPNECCGNTSCPQSPSCTS